VYNRDVKFLKYIRVINFMILLFSLRTGDKGFFFTHTLGTHWQNKENLGIKNNMNQNYCTMLPARIIHKP
jgi:hypothetical protein